MSMFTPPGIGARRPGRRPSGARRRVLVVTLALTMIVAGAWVAWQAGAGAEDVRTEPPPSCPAPSATPTVVPAAEITVNVYNASDRRGLAARVAGELKRRGFAIGKVDNDPLKRAVTGSAEVRSGPAGADAARTVGAQVGEVVTVPDQRKKPTVDLAIGAGFTQLLPPDEAAAALSPTTEPVPAGC